MEARRSRPRFTVDPTRSVRDDGVTAIDNALERLGSGELIHAMDPTRIQPFSHGGPPVWSICPRSPSIAFEPSKRGVDVLQNMLVLGGALTAPIMQALLAPARTRSTRSARQRSSSRRCGPAPPPPRRRKSIAAQSKDEPVTTARAGEATPSNRTQSRKPADRRVDFCPTADANASRRAAL